MKIIQRKRKNQHKTRNGTALGKGAFYWRQDDDLSGYCPYLCDKVLYKYIYPCKRRISYFEEYHRKPGAFSLLSFFN